MAKTNFSKKVQDFMKEHKELYGEAEDNKLKTRVFSLLSTKNELSAEMTGLEIAQELLQEKMDNIDKEIKELK